MHKRGMWAAGLAGVMIVEMGVGRAAHAADDPLLVVVEAQPGLGVDAADVRRRIAGELHQLVVSPSDPAAPRASQVLIVSLDETDIRISVRSGATAHVSRTIPDVAERAARLRAVAWLAGNLARDQVGPLLPKLALAAAPEPAAPAQATTAPPAIEPSPIDGTRLATTDAAISSSAKTGDPEIAPRWTVTASGGATVTDTCLQVGWRTAVTCGPTGGAASPFVFGSTYQLEVQHHALDEGIIVGGALDAGPDGHLVGLAGLIGIRRPWGSWYLEATLGAGIDADRLNVATTTVVNSSSTGVGSQVTVSPQVQPVLYARATGSIGIPINRAFDFMARLSAHLASSGLGTDFIGVTAGLRLKLP